MAKKKASQQQSQAAAKPQQPSPLRQEQALPPAPRPDHSPRGDVLAEQDSFKVPSPFTNPVESAKALWALYESTFAISMLETWESLLLHAILLTILYFLYWATRAYLPDHVRFLATRAKYYWLGEETSL